MSIDRDVLIGLLALQNGMIGRERLAEALREGGGRPLAERVGLGPDERGLLEALTEHLLGRHGGDVGKSLALLELSDSTRETLSTSGGTEVERTLTQVGPGSSETDADRTGTYAGVERQGGYSVGDSTADGRRFRVLRPYARGGLGAVFVAMDGERNREVALKEILDGHADDPVSRQRFLVEAEITGGLEHPGIVPVYGLGRYGDGRPYYAMRFIRGESLKEAIDRFYKNGESKGDGLEMRKLLRRFLDVCNAMEYAHSRGVLHRDLKPGNVIVGRHGETLVVDWGLAKAQGRSDPDVAEGALRPSSASGSGETMPGQALGTPAYMSPEQARGDLEALGPKSDVYSLGATLYCLLTGKAPFEGKVAEVLDRVRHGDFQAPRHLHPSIDRALEAICLKAMENRPEDRYASCRALADDLERWMADERVMAWREPWTRSLVRWLTRHRTGVTGAGAAGLALMVGLAAMAGVQARGNAALAAKNGELEVANEKIRERYDLAMDAIGTFHRGVSEDFLLQENQFKTLRDKLLESAQGFYGKLSKLLEKDADVASRRALADSNFELARLTSEVGHTDDALAAHRAVLAAREALMGTSEDDVSLRADIGRSDAEVAELLWTKRDADGSLAMARKGEALLAGRSGTDVAAVTQLAACRYWAAEALVLLGRNEDALAAYERSRMDLETVVAAPGATTESRGQLGMVLRRLGLLEWNTGRGEKAEAHFREALDLCEALAQQHPEDVDFRRRLAASHTLLSHLLGNQDEIEEEQAEKVEALEILKALVAERPAVSEIRHELASAHTNLGNTLWKRANHAEAEMEFRTAMAVRQALVDDHPENADYREGLARLRGTMGLVMSAGGKAKEAEDELREASRIQEEVIALHPADVGHQTVLAQFRLNLADLLANLGRVREAEGEYRSAGETLQRLAARQPEVVGFHDQLAQIQTKLGYLLSRTGRPDEAIQESREAVAIRARLVEQNVRVVKYRFDLAVAHQDLGQQLREWGRMGESEAELRAAREEYERLADDRPEVPEYRTRLAYALDGIALAVLDSPRKEEALELEKQALAMREKLAEESPTITDFRRNLVVSHNNMGLTLLRMGRYAEARESYDRALEVGEPLARDHPSNIWYRTGPAFSLRERGVARMALGDVAGAAEDTRGALDIWETVPTRTGEQWFATACCHAALAALASRPGSGVAKDLAETEAEKAMEVMRETLEAGFKDLARMGTDEALDALRGRADFQLMMMDLAFPRQAFGGARP